MITRPAAPVAPANAPRRPCPAVRTGLPRCEAAPRGAGDGSSTRRTSASAHAYARATPTGGTCQVQRRRPPRSRSRAEHWVARIRAAASGREALSHAWNWVLSEQQSTREIQPDRADSACWELALNVAAYAARMPRARIARRTGLAPDEVARLLDPWARDRDEEEQR